MVDTSGICLQCDDPVVVLPTGWYRCRQCGHESVCAVSAHSAVLEVAKAIFIHRCQFDLPDDATDAELRVAAGQAIQQGEQFESALSERHL